MNKSVWLSLLIPVGLFSSFIVTAILLLHWLKVPGLSAWTGLMIAFLFIVTLSGLGLISVKYRQNQESFSKYYFIVMILRFFLGILFVLAGLLLINENRVIFVTNFLVLYLLFLGFEIYYLIANFHSRTSR